MARKLVPGEVVALAAVAGPLAADVWLLHRGHLSVSSCVRRSWLARAVTTALAAHLLFTLRHDPLTWAGSHFHLRQP